MRKYVFDSSVDRQGNAKMAWIESHTVLIRHRKLRELARDLRLRPSHALGHLHALWHAALEQREDGNLSSWSDEFIAEMSDYPGDAPQYVRLLEKHGWLAAKKIHDWLDYVGLYLTKKYGTSNRDKLVEIWSIHGRKYGERGKRTKGDLLESGQITSSELVVNQQRTESEPTVPNQPTNQTGEFTNSTSQVPVVDTSPPDDAQSPFWLKREWIFYVDSARRRNAHDDESEKNFGNLMRLGAKYEAILASIREPSRDRSEPIWVFCDRVQGKGKNGKPATPSPKDQLQLAREQEARQKAEIDAKKGIKP